MLKIVENRNKFFIISASILIIGIIITTIYVASGHGVFNYDIEFTGGTAMQVNIEKDFKNSEVSAIFKDAVGHEPQIQNVLGTREIMIKSTLLSVDDRNTIIAKLKEKYAITDDDVLNVSDVSATISSEMQTTALLAILSASLLMLIYISLRFRDLRLGSAAILALLHDIAILIVVYAVFRIPINNSFIAAILTILGFSINATIVIFDRVRENKKKMKRSDLPALINTSVTQTLNRSIFTSITTMIAITSVYIFGVESIRQFALPIMIGIVGGTYSSVCISGALWYVFVRGTYKKNTKTV